MTPLVHLGSRDHEQWSVQRGLSMLTGRATSTREAVAEGLYGRRVLCWHYNFWSEIPPERRTGNRVLCFFYHHRLDGIDDPQVVAGLCLNHAMAAALRARQPDKPVWVVRPGSAEDARPHARRRHSTRKIRLLLAGNASAPWREEAGGPGEGRMTGDSRKGTELVPALARRLDRRRYAWVFVGPGWEPQAEELRRCGWTVLLPGPLPAPQHYGYYGEGDVYLMLSRLEGGPLPLLETMGLGLWPICTSTGLVPDLILHGENGHRVTAYDGANGEAVAGEIATCLRSLDHERLKAARPRVQSSVAGHTWDAFRREVEAALRQVFGTG